MHAMPITIPARDGYPLTARCYAPDGPVQGAVLIVPAMGVPQSYYSAFAHWLAGLGWQVTTFDYRGMGESRHGPLRRVQASVISWAEQDVAAVLDRVADGVPGKPVVWLGHSLGGQMMGFTPNIHRASRAITVASGSGYWLENAPPLKRKAWLLWFVVAPLTLPLFGYFPGARLGMVGDLPRGVMQQWRKWCLNRDYAVGAEGEAMRQRYAAVRLPITAHAFADDEFMSARNIESLHSHYTGAPRQVHHHHPRDHGVKRIGHFGFFRAAHRDTLWPKLIQPALGT